MPFRLNTHSLPVTALILLSAPLLAMQDAGKSKPAGGTKPAATARPGTATIAQPVNLPVSGLTKENQEKVQAALGALTQTLWTCPGCNSSQGEKGTCTACKEDLVPESHKVFSSVKADAERSGVTLDLSPGVTIKLSQIQLALGAAAVKVDSARLVLGGSTQLHIQGPGSADAARKLEESLKSAKLFESMEIRHAAEGRDYRVAVRAGATAPAQAAVVAAIERAGEGFKLTDVAWAGPEPVS
jgi:hypothetical protein